MDAKHLTPAQLASLAETTARHLRYLTRLVQRMDRLRWSPTDPLYLATLRARDMTHAMSGAIHSAGARMGLGE